MQTDNQLVRKIKKKQNKQAANELIERYYKEIYAYVYQQTVDIELAMDLTQEVFISVIKGLELFDERKASFRTWLYRIASNKVIDYYRSKTHRIEMASDYFEEKNEQIFGVVDVNLERIFNQETIIQVMEIISCFSAEWVEIFQKKCFEEKTFTEISDQMGISPNTVKTRFYKMIKKVKEEVDRFE